MFAPWVPLMVAGRGSKKPGKPLERAGNKSMPFRIGVMEALMASGNIASLVFVIVNKQMPAKKVITLEIAGLSPYPD